MRHTISNITFQSDRGGGGVVQGLIWRMSILSFLLVAVMITLELVICFSRKLEIFMHLHFEFCLVTGDFMLYADWSR